MQNNRSAQRTSWGRGPLRRRPVWLALLSLAVGISGCTGGRADVSDKWGGMSEQEWRQQYNARQKAEAREEAEAKKKVEEAKKAKDEQKQAEAKEKKQSRATGAAAQNRGVPQPPQEELPPLPAAVSDWKEHDFYIARISGDPMLVPAVEHLGTHAAGDEDAARLLAKLLQPNTLADLRDKFAGTKKKTRKVKPGLLIESIVKALGANGTAAARQVLEQLVTGELKTEDDSAAAEAGLEALVEHPSDQSEAILFHLVTASEQVRLPTRGRLGADKLQRRALELLASSASVSLRIRVARFLVDPETPDERRASLSGLLYQAAPANLEAQIVLYQDAYMEPEARTAIEGHFVRYSSQALGTVLGWPTDRRVTVAESQFGSRVARWLWGPQFDGLLRDRLLRIESLQASPAVVVLAATVPTHPMRATLYQVLQKHWHEGPEALESAGLATEVICEPGLLTLINLLAREQSSTARPRSRNKMNSSRQARILEIAEARQELEAAWETTIELLLEQLCRRFDAATAREAGGTQPPSPSLARAGLPVGLPPDTRLLAVYRLDWPQTARGPAGAELPKDPMRVCYLRIEGRTTIAKLKGFFRRQFRSYAEHEIDRGFRLDCLRKGSIPGQQQSIDVLVTHTEPEGFTLRDQEQLLVAEVLSVEIGDPRELPPAAGRSPNRTEGAAYGTVSLESEF